MAAPCPRLIFCADGNAAHAAIAIEEGWLYGARLPAKGLAPHRLHFADQDWKRPDREKYMACLRHHRPPLATVLDWEREGQLTEVISWGEEAAQYVGEAVLWIPKVPGAVGFLPRRVGGKECWLAYSVPTKYGGSPLGLWELAGWPVHLLGGSPQEQRKVYAYLRSACDVRSLDGNMAKKMATGRCCYWTRQTTAHGHWQPIRGEWEPGAKGAVDECLRRSLRNVLNAWGVAV